MSEIGEYLRNLRSSKKLSLKKVQSLTGITDSRLSKIENGHISDPPAKELLTLSEIYNVNIVELFIRAEYMFEHDYHDNNIFHNTNKLKKNEIEFIQHTIDFFIANREKANNDF